MTFDPYQRRVKSEMSDVVVTASPDQTVFEALMLMREHGVTVLPLVDDADRCVGVFSTSDLVAISDDLAEVARDLGHLNPTSRRLLTEKLIELGIAKRTVGEISKGNLVTTGPDVLIGDAGRDMLVRHIHHLLIIDEQQRLQGIVSSLDLLAAFVKGDPSKGNQD